MEEFRVLFLHLCQEHRIDPQESVCKRIEELSANNATQLDLSNNTLTLGTCEVLGKTLTHDLAFTSLVLSDCMLNEEGAKILLSGLSKNSTIKTLDLRGNNLRQASAEALGKYLKVCVLDLVFCMSGTIKALIFSDILCMLSKYFKIRKLT